MKKCMFEDFIDDYLLNRLVKNKENKFEEHYFNCPYCFGKMMERQEFISIVKNMSTNTNAIIPRSSRGAKRRGDLVNSS